MGAYLLSIDLLERSELSNQKDDIDKSILYLTESLLLFPLSWLACGLMILEALSGLALRLYMRSGVSKKPEDAIYAANYAIYAANNLRHLRDPAHTPFASHRQEVTAMLVKTLALQMELKASDVIHTLEEMTALTQELLTSDPSSDHTTHASACFARAVANQLSELSPDLLLNEVIECLRLARLHKPELREVPFTLALGLVICSSHTLNDELDEVVSILDELITSSSPGDELLGGCQKLLVRIAML